MCKHKINKLRNKKGIYKEMRYFYEKLVRCFNNNNYYHYYYYARYLVNPKPRTLSGQFLNLDGNLTSATFFFFNSLVWQTRLCVLWQQLFSRDFWYFLILVGLEIPQKQLSLWYFGTSTIRTRWYTEVQRKHWIWIMIHFKKSSYHL